MQIVGEHLQKLKTSNLTHVWPGKKPQGWYQKVAESLNFDPHLYAALSSTSVTRGDLFQMVASKSHSTLACCISILAWGGMRTGYGSLFLSVQSEWLTAANEIRHGSFDRTQAYARFANLRDEGKMPGVAPAYFTKLIFFLMPENEKKPRGYIMDQWTSSSINLLFGSKIIHTKISKKRRDGDELEETVVDKNTEVNYEYFCKAVETVADLLEIEPMATEEMMFSNGGTKKGDWRKHVIASRLISYKASRSHI